MNPDDLGRFFQTSNAKLSRCLDPGMQCQDPAIRAHSIQNSRVLDLLAVDGHVIMPKARFSKAGPEIDFASVGRNQASTFTGLCGAHDNAIFAPLDTKPIDFEDREQLFLLAYRSVTRELHAVMEGAAKVQSSYSSLVERGIDSGDTPSNAARLATSHLMKVHETWLYRAQYFDKPLTSGQYDEVEHDVLLFINQPPCIAVSSLFSMDEVTREGETVRAVLNILPLDDCRTAAVFSYAQVDSAKARAEVGHVLSAQGFHQKYELSKLVLSRMENFVISPAVFARWPAAKVVTIKNAFAQTILGRSSLPDNPDLMMF